MENTQMVEINTYKTITQTNQFTLPGFPDDPQYVWSCWQTLTPRERQVAKLICKKTHGAPTTNPEIAGKLGISQETVKIHVRNILSKFDLHSKFDFRLVLSNWDLETIN